MNVPAGPRKSDFLYTNFLTNFPPISIPFLKERHPILTKLGAFCNNLPKIHQIFVIWVPSSLIKLLIAIPNFAKKRPKGRHICIPYQCETPPPTWTVACYARGNHLFLGIACESGHYLHCNVGRAIAWEVANSSTKISNRSNVYFQNASKLRFRG